MNWKNIVRFEAYNQKIKPMLRVEVDFIFHFKTKARHDPDNYAATIKMIMDGLVDCGVLHDDNFDYVRKISIERGCKCTEKVEIILREVKN